VQLDDLNYFHRRVISKVQTMDISEAIKQMRTAEKRGFNQSIDLIVTLKNIDLKKPENKFSKRIVLPNGRGKDVSICVIAEKGDVDKFGVEGFEKDKKAAKKFSKQYEFYLCEAPLMPLVGKILGRYLAPKGKMPELLMPGRSPDAMKEEMKKSIRIRVRDAPTIQTIIGSESMKDEEIKENAEKVVEEIKKALPAKVGIRNIYMKATMGKPLKIGV
jgi:large subunit ribosomal protein L1